MSLRAAAAPVLALSASIGLHALVFSARPVETTARESGGGAPTVVRLGNSFADAVAGAPVVPEPVVNTAVAVATTEVPMSKPKVASVAAVEPKRTAVPVTAEVTPISSTSAATVVGAEPATGPVSSPLPRARRDPKTSEPKPDRPAKPASPASTPGSADDEARAGSSSGKPDAKPVAEPASDQPRAAGGNASVSNYPGMVMKKLRSTKKDRLGTEGRVVVGFGIAANGALASVQVVRSSGNATLDAAAIAYVKRAAPFPPPPPGAETRFSFEFASR